MRPGSRRGVVQKAAVDLIQSLGAVAGANRHGADGPARRHRGARASVVHGSGVQAH